MFPGVVLQPELSEQNTGSSSIIPFPGSRPHHPGAASETRSTTLEAASRPVEATPRTADAAQWTAEATPRTAEAVLSPVQRTQASREQVAIDLQ